MLLGGLSGAKVGSVAGPWGMGIGALIGATGGGYGGMLLGGRIGGALGRTEEGIGFIVTPDGIYHLAKCALSVEKARLENTEILNAEEPSQAHLPSLNGP